MGKTAPIKKKGAASVHSRSAKRASSPGIDLDKSLKDLKPPFYNKTTRPSILVIHQGAGVTKKAKHGRKAVMSAKAKRRQEKGLDLAEAIMAKKEIKIEKSKNRARTVQERSKNWDELNKKMIAKNVKDEASALEKEHKMEDELNQIQIHIEREISDDCNISHALPELASVSQYVDAEGKEEPSSNSLSLPVDSEDEIR